MTAPYTRPYHNPRHPSRGSNIGDTRPGPSSAESGAINELLRKADDYGCQAESIWKALSMLKRMPSMTILEAVEYANRETGA